MVQVLPNSAAHADARATAVPRKGSRPARAGGCGRWAPAMRQLCFLAFVLYMLELLRRPIPRKPTGRCSQPMTP